MSINGLETEFESKRATEAKRWGGIAPVAIAAFLPSLLFSCYALVLLLGEQLVLSDTT